MSTPDIKMVLQSHEQTYADIDPCCHTEPSADRAIKLLQTITISWMLVECSVALTAAWRAHSPALLAFGADSSVELLSAVIVLLQFTSIVKISPKRAARIAGLLLFVLAGIVAMISMTAIVLKVAPDTSALGIGVTIVALAVMPVLSRAKRRKANAIGNRALAADAVQSATCAYLAGFTLLGLVLNATLHFHWVDPLAALAALPILVLEARRAIRGDVCGCC